MARRSAKSKFAITGQSWPQTTSRRLRKPEPGKRESTEKTPERSKRGAMQRGMGYLVDLKGEES